MDRTFPRPRNSGGAFAHRVAVIKVSVTDLAHFVHRRGDIHFRYYRNVEPADGIRAQKALQRTRPEGYQREVALSLELEGEPNVVVRGRADGVDESGPVAVIEEIKSSRTDLDAAGFFLARHCSINGSCLSLASRGR